MNLSHFSLILQTAAGAQQWHGRWHALDGKLTLLPNSGDRRDESIALDVDAATGRIRGLATLRVGSLTRFICTGAWQATDDMRVDLRLTSSDARAPSLLLKATLTAGVLRATLASSNAVLNGWHGVATQCAGGWRMLLSGAAGSARLELIALTDSADLDEARKGAQRA